MDDPKAMTTLECQQCMQANAGLIWPNAHFCVTVATCLFCVVCLRFMTHLCMFAQKPVCKTMLGSLSFE